MSLMHLMITLFILRESLSIDYVWQYSEEEVYSTISLLTFKLNLQNLLLISV